MHACGVGVFKVFGLQREGDDGKVGIGFLYLFMFLLEAGPALLIAGGGLLFCLCVVEGIFISLRMIQRDYLMRMDQEFIG